MHMNCQQEYILKAAGEPVSVADGSIPDLGVIVA